VTSRHAAPRAPLHKIAVLLVASLIAACVVSVRRYGDLPEELLLLSGARGDVPKDPRAMLLQGRVRSDVLVVGARIFDERCAVCHGDRGFGDGTLADVLPMKPRNYHDEAFPWGTRPSQIVTTVANGRSGIMPPFRDVLSEQELWAVAYLVWGWIPEDRRASDSDEELASWTLPPPPSAEE